MSVDLEIRIIGIRRGGNHAINNWICSLLGENVLNLRNVRNPIEFSYNYSRYHHKENDVEKEYLKGSFDYAVLGYENICPKEVKAFDGLKSNKVKTIVVLRDAFNTAASLVKKIRNSDENEIREWIGYFYQFPDLWRIFSKLFISESEDFILINFNEWFVSKQYRINVADQIGLDISNEDINHVSYGGGGSSFDGISKDGCAQDMDILNRWEGMENDVLLNIALYSRTILKRNKAIFGKNPFRPKVGE